MSGFESKYGTESGASTTCPPAQIPQKPLANCSRNQMSFGLNALDVRHGLSTLMIHHKAQNRKHTAALKELFQRRMIGTIRAVSSHYNRTKMLPNSKNREITKKYILKMNKNLVKGEADPSIKTSWYFFSRQIGLFCLYIGTETRIFIDWCCFHYSIRSSLVFAGSSICSSTWFISWSGLSVRKSSILRVGPSPSGAPDLE